ncbi:hypothetical protein B0T20DRAFT_388909 [Sordaria brevicollis]|uniref:Uncharacterized protein n=1 Tax=Sordaria brevicollis TaxID=83679 RepID=A0AAE0UGC4_SORBR|nr:hypothetical protein B0T20DRAFT_388909 [Sordaria brevicollis]
MAGTSQSDDLKFINTFERELERTRASGNSGTDSMSMSNFVRDIDAIGRESSKNNMTITTPTTTTIEDKGTTPTTNGLQTDTNPTTEARHGHEICPNPLPWSPHQHFQGPMCGCPGSNWSHDGTSAHDQSEPKTS